MALSPLRSVPLRLALGIALSCMLAAAPAGAAQASPPPAAAFFGNAEFGGATLSPSGRYLAARTGAPGKPLRLMVVDLQDNSVKTVAAFTDSDIHNFQWVNDERLVFDVTDRNVAPGDMHFAAGLFAVNRDGEAFLQLAARRTGRGVVKSSTLAQKRMLPWHTFMLPQPGSQDSPFIYVESTEFDHAGREVNNNLLRLDTLTGLSQLVERPGKVSKWMLGQDGEPRLATVLKDDKLTLYYRAPGSQGWRQLYQAVAFRGDNGAFTPLGFGPDGLLYVEANNGRDTSALYTVDTASGKLSPAPVLTAPGYDFEGHLVANKDKLLGVRLLTDARDNVWFDAGMKAVQEKIDQQLPNTINLITPARNPQAAHMLVESYSDVQPPVFWLADIKTGKLNKVGESHAAIKPAEMGGQQFVRYKARDGREIPALLTLPAGASPKNLPLVMLVHGGPFVRGTEMGWKAQAQFLASRGYAVLEPEYRGSTGFGNAHFRAGWKQWGLGMQDDIADGARWAARQGYADPDRICIAGGSYGGYAALMGVVKDPGLYRCAVDWMGVTDINLLHDGHWSAVSDASDAYLQYGLPVLVGDQVRDAAQLQATSPIQQAARIKAPLLLAYGGVDRRVPLYHGTLFRDAVKKHNNAVEWVEYPDEGHGLALEADRIDFWTRVEKFLDQNIGAGRKPAQP
ncbi:prolyl oligopeptidase family serine peptidase [Massilia sp. YIM B02769]|uniref:alpha/beta hydrolase family protein n=1 Tax=Massilia sp. TaxID=1882437 RepID=UPI0025C773ED|nr:prolyl oligopeptidase family serine peptidase [Massilia sp.]MDN4057696.1 prolyl oligopeptidase family serine peptidase [Massilia sp. YIM B02769]